MNPPNPINPLNPSNPPNTLSPLNPLSPPSPWHPPNSCPYPPNLRFKDSCKRGTVINITDFFHGRNIFVLSQNKGLQKEEF